MVDQHHTVEKTPSKVRFEVPKPSENADNKTENSDEPKSEPTNEVGPF